MTRWTVEDRRRRLVARHFPVVDVADDAAIGEVVRGLCQGLVALHATDPVGVYLQLQARLPGITPDDVARVLYDDRSVVRTLAMRRTLFVVDPADLPMLQAAVSDKIASTERRRVARWIEADGLAHDGVAWMEAAEDTALAALVEHGPLATRDLGAVAPTLAARVVAGSGKWATEVSLASKAIWSLAVSGRAVRGRPGGSLASSSWTWVPTDDWLGTPLPEPPSVQDAAVALAGRYLAAFGPATFTDLQWWTGWTKTLTRTALAGLELSQVIVEDGHGGTSEALTRAGDDEPTTGASDAAADSGSSTVRFLPVLDLTPMGWKQRGFYLGDHGTFPSPFFDSVGNIGPTIWHGGQIVGAWGQRSDGEVRWRLLDELPPAVVDAVEEVAPRRASAIQAFLGVARSPRFPTPWQRELSA